MRAATAFELSQGFVQFLWGVLPREHAGRRVYVSEASGDR
jgi:hypothetical protein